MRLSKCIIFIISISSAYCFSKTEEISNSTFKQLYSQLEVAALKCDAKAFRKLLSPNFQSEATSGDIINTEQMLSGLSGCSAIDPDKKSSTTILSVSNQGRTAFVKQQYIENSRRRISDGTYKYIKLVATYNDTWEFSNGHWLLLKTVNQEVIFSVDGRKVNHSIHK